MDPKDRFKLIPAVHLFMIKDGMILLLRRFNTGYEDGNFSVPAGHLDGGESVIAAMIREAREETDVTVSREQLQIAHVMHRNDDVHERIDFFFTTSSWEGEPQIVETDKCDKLAWYPVDQLPQNMVPYVQTAIELYRKDVYFSEFGWQENR